jgi:hypothetical protein
MDADPKTTTLTKMSAGSAPSALQPRTKSKLATVAKLDIPEFGQAISEIERDLNKHRIGTFRVHRKDMTFAWKDRANRAEASLDRMAKLLKSMQNGLFRTDIRHRMSGIVDRKAIARHIAAPDKETKRLDLDAVAEFNQNAVFPSIVFSKDRKGDIEMQSGQHRMLSLRYLFADNPEQHWWIVTVYDKGLSLVDAYGRKY